jgi:hypothetical protein
MGRSFGLFRDYPMALRLRNQKNPQLSLSLTNEAWFGVLDLAEAYGWNPMGTVQPGYWIDLDLDLQGYSPEIVRQKTVRDLTVENRLVLLEDALNLADALESAFLDYEPVRVPASYFLFEPDIPSLRLRPSIGVITAVMDFCRCGSFWIERYFHTITL